MAVRTTTATMVRLTWGIKAKGSARLRERQRGTGDQQFRWGGYHQGNRMEPQHDGMKRDWGAWKEGTFCLKFTRIPWIPLCGRVFGVHFALLQRKERVETF